MHIVERCPEVVEITGSPVEEKGLIKGKMASGVADMHFLVHGPKGDVHISLTGIFRSRCISRQASKGQQSGVRFANSGHAQQEGGG